MKRFVGIFLFGILAVTVVPLGIATSGHGQVMTPEELRLENARSFEKWQKSIPDYEKRLYDRVKGINKRVIRVQNLVIGSFVLLLIINGVFLTLIYRRIGAVGMKTDTKPGARQGVSLFFKKILSRVVVAPDDSP